MNKELMQKAVELASRNYSLSVFNDEASDGEPIFLAKNPELYGCMAQGSTLEDAIKNLEEARIDYIYSLLEDGLEVPEPAPDAVSTFITEETAAPVQVNFVKTITFKDNKAVVTGPLKSKPLYEVSLRI